MVKSIKNILLAIYCTIAGPDGLLISGAILFNVFNTVYLKVNLYRMIKDDLITVNKANALIVGEIFIGFILASFLYLIIKEAENEGVRRDS